MNRLPVRIFALALGILIATVAKAQIPDTYTNLKVLPKDIQKAELMDRMKSMSRSLGVRCWFCHKGKEGEPLSTYDFASDENKHKDMARTMMRMTGEINAKYLKDFKDKITCNTCHQGKKEPRE